MADRRRTSIGVTVPVEVTSFVGRLRDSAELETLVTQSRLVTVTGPGGVGKTRLAMRVATAVAPHFADGVFWVDLAPVAAPALVPSSVLAALSIGNHAGADELTLLTARLRQRRCLLVLDNCEHLAGACAAVADRLVHTCPGVAVLATSREALGVPGEVIRRVAPLECPQPTEPASTLLANPYPAVQLFVERAALAAPGFTLTERNAPAVAQVCSRLDGMPLAIELAAARLQAFSVEQIAAHLDDAFGLLTSGSRTASPRQQTLRGALDWSYALLSPGEGRLFARLAIFAGGWPLEGAEAVCSGGSLNQSVMPLLAQLVSKSLVVTEACDGAVRYRFLQTVRDYAFELVSEEERNTLRAKHFQWCLRVAESPHFFHGPGQHHWLQTCDAEYENLRAALQWAVDTGHAHEGAKLAEALWFYWDNRGLLGEWRGWLQRLIGLPGELTSPRVRATSALSYITLAQGDAPGALAIDHETLKSWQSLGDAAGVAWAKKRIGIDHLALGELAAAQRYLEEALTEARAAAATAPTYLALLLLGDLSRAQQRYGQAAGYYQDSLSLMQAEGDTSHTAHAVLGLACVRQAQGRLAEAQPFITQSLELFHTLGDRRVIAACLDALGSLAVEQGEAQRAARLFGAAAGLRESIGAASAHALFAAERERGLARSRERLSHAQFEEAWNEGMTMGYDKALAMALASPTSRGLAAGSGWPASLTPRECEIAGLLVERLTNREIAQRLVISEQTAETHVKRVLSKLAVTSRNQVAAWQRDHNPTTPETD
jgi:non-specific serine/threonine protein kinase